MLTGTTSISDGVVWRRALWQGLDEPPSKGPVVPGCAAWGQRARAFWPPERWLRGLVSVQAATGASAWAGFCFET